MLGLDLVFSPGQHVRIRRVKSRETRAESPVGSGKFMNIFLLFSKPHLYWRWHITCHLQTRWTLTIFRPTRKDLITIKSLVRYGSICQNMEYSLSIFTRVHPHLFCSQCSSNPACSFLPTLDRLLTILASLHLSHPP